MLWPVLNALPSSRFDGSEDRSLRHLPWATRRNNLHAAWSPDGRWVVFEVLETSGDIPAASIWIVGVDGRHPQQLVACSSAPCAQYAYPAWSRDGSKLAMIRFGQYADGSCCTSELVVFDVARSKRSREWTATNEQVVAAFGDADVATTYDAFYGPTWSPDGRYLAYMVEQYDVEDPYPLPGTRIAVVSRSGGDARLITPLELNAGKPYWNPCADLIAFNTYPLSTFQELTAPGNVYTIRPDGRRPRSSPRNPSTARCGSERCTGARTGGRSPSRSLGPRTVFGWTASRWRHSPPKGARLPSSASPAQAPCGLRPTASAGAEAPRVRGRSPDDGRPARRR